MGFYEEKSFSLMEFSLARFTNSTNDRVRPLKECFYETLDNKVYALWMVKNIVKQSLMIC